MNVLGKNYYKLKSMEITAMKVLKTLLLHAMLPSIDTPPPRRKKVCRVESIPFHE